MLSYNIALTLKLLTKIDEPKRIKIGWLDDTMLSLKTNPMN